MRGGKYTRKSVKMTDTQDAEVQDDSNATPTFNIGNLLSCSEHPTNKLLRDNKEL